MNNNKQVLNLSPVDLINFAYKVAEKEFKDQSFTFNTLWSKVWKKADDFRHENVEDWIGNFYTELIQDPRFVTTGTSTWKLRKFLTFDEIKRIENTMFIFEKDEIYEEGYDANYTDVPIGVEENEEDNYAAEIVPEELTKEEEEEI